MSDLKPITLRELRDLARKHLGRGHSRLKTKDELLDALKKAVPELLTDRTVPAKAARPAPAPVAAPEVEVRPEPAEPVPVEPVQAESATVSAPEPRLAPPEPKVEPAPEPEVAPPTLGAATAEFVSEGFFARREQKGRPTAPSLEEPVVEGFFVARIAGARELRRLRLAGNELRARRPHEEDLGELPAEYPDESAVLLARDPTTLYFFWDFRPSLRRLPVARPVHVVLRVLDGGRTVREEEFPLDAKTFYVQGLTPGRTYRIEAYVRGADGNVAPLRIATNPVTLPANAPSGDLSVRMMRVPWAAPLGRFAGTVGGAGGHLEITAERGLPSSMSGRARPPSGEGLPPHLAEGVSGENLPSSMSWVVRRVWPETVPPPPGLPPHLVEGVARGAMPSSFTGAPRPQEVAAPLDLPPHLELPSSHTWRGGAEERSPSSPHPRRKS